MTIPLLFSNSGRGDRGGKGRGDQYRSDMIEVDNFLPTYPWRSAVRDLFKNTHIDIMMEVKTVVKAVDIDRSTFSNIDDTSQTSYI